MSLQVSEDSKTATIQINGTYSAQELEELIAELGALRSTMEPPVPLRSPLPPKEPFVPFAIEADPTFDVFKSKQTAVVRMLMRSSAMGWIAYDINPRNASTLASWFRDNVVAVPALEKVNLDSPTQ